MRTNFILDSVLTGLRRNVTMTIALILNTAITLAFVGAALLANQEISQFKASYENRLNVTVLLCGPNDTNIKTCTTRAVIDPKTGKQEVVAGIKQYTATTTRAQEAAIRTKLEADPRVTSVKYVSMAEQVKLVKIQLPQDTKSIQVGDLPASFTVHLKDIKSDYNPFVKAIAGTTGIGQVVDQSTILSKLLDTIDGIRLFSILVALVVLIASILLIANTIQVAAQQRRNETSIMRLVGASRWMTEAPFLLETAVAALVGGIISAGMLFAGKAFVLDNIFKVQVENGVIPNLSSNDIIIACGEGVIAGVIVSALTAFLTLRLYVKL